MLKKAGGVLLIVLFFLAVSLQAQVRVLHAFDGADGAAPQGSLIQSGSFFYGMANTYGKYEFGTVFRAGIDGTGFQVLHAFGGGSADGQYPQDSLVLGGSTLYGTTEYGGAYDYGTIFKINTDGTGYTILHSFADEADGKYPFGSLILYGSKLYGLASEGGAYYYGTLFVINTDGTGYAVLHDFKGGPSEGEWPRGTLLLVGSTFYAMTTYGGAYAHGTIFKINMDGSGFALLHSFAGSPRDGAASEGTLSISGSILFGTTLEGGGVNLGTVFKINTDGSGFRILHSFDGWPTEGNYPTKSLTFVGSVLYGMTEWGGAHKKGTVFKLSKNGTGYAIVHSFSGGVLDGIAPFGGLLGDKQRLYGMTAFGGAWDRGTIFRLILPKR
jgi:uncharacterized repeat protein (TIGR03803 family)